MRFVVIDLETANPRMSSICQIGAVLFDGGVELEAESFLVDPQDYFDPYCVGIHGITPERVKGAPSFSALHDWLCRRTHAEVVVCHTHFDRVAITQACAAGGLMPLTCTWLDSAKVARRAWSQFSNSGYGLKNLACHFGIEFKHHDALEDARAAGRVLMRAIEETGLTPAEWVTRCSTHQGSAAAIRRAGDGDGPLLGESVVFTGSLALPRRQAADLAHEAGAAVESGVTWKTTLLVVGDQDIAKLNGAQKSSKHRKAEKLINDGAPIRIVGEADFMTMCHS